MVKSYPAKFITNCSNFSIRSLISFYYFFAPQYGHAKTYLSLIHSSSIVIIYFFHKFVEFNIPY